MSYECELTSAEAAAAEAELHGTKAEGAAKKVNAAGLTYNPMMD